MVKRVAAKPIKHITKNLFIFSSLSISLDFSIYTPSLQAEPCTAWCSGRSEAISWGYFVAPDCRDSSQRQLPFIMNDFSRVYLNRPAIVKRHRKLTPFQKPDPG